MKQLVSHMACLGVFALLSPFVVAQTAKAVSATQTGPTVAQNKEANLKAYISMMRKDVKKDKVAILTELMGLGPESAAKFWPVYNEYDQALTKLGDERIVFIRMYADSFSSLDDATATKIATGMMDVEGKRMALRKQYFEKLSQTLTPKDAVRWLQIEAQLEKIVDLQILSSLPIVQ